MPSKESTMAVPASRGGTSRRGQAGNTRRANRTPISLDPDLLEQAQKVLGTSGKQDTVDAALARVVQAAALDEELAWLATDPLAELRDADARAAMWRE